MNIYLHLFYITFPYNIYIWFLLLYYKMTEMRNIFKRAKRNLFRFAEYKYAAYFLNRHRQLARGRNACGAIFTNVLSIKYVHWNRPNFFDSESSLYELWEKISATKTIDYGFGQTSPLQFLLTRIRTLSIDPNLKMSTILFALRYRWYKDA